MNTPIDFIVFDIETAPLPVREVEHFYKPGKPFLLEECKAKYATARRGDAKGTEFIKEKRQQHERDESDRYAKFLEGRTLNPLQSRVAAIITTGGDPDTTRLFSGLEKDILANFWELYVQTNAASRSGIGLPFVFWSGSGDASMFDVDFIVQRSLALGLRIPVEALQGRYYSPRFVDLAAEFLRHRHGTYLSLSNAAQSFGLLDANPELALKAKDAEVRGANWHRFWYGTEEERAKAEAYLLNDYALTCAVALHLKPLIRYGR